MTNRKDDRDSTIDRLLAGAMTPPIDAPSGECLEADTLAAWADNALSGAELAAAEAHAAECARCQAMLAAMAKTAPAPAEAAAPWWMPSLRWLVPLTATAAAAVLVWVLVLPRGTNVRQVTQIAESSTPAEPPSLAEPPSPAPPATADRERRAQPTPEEAKEVNPPRQSANSARADLEADKKSEAPRDAAAVAEAPAGRPDLSRQGAENAKADEPTRRADVRLEKAPAAPAAAAPAAAAPVAATAARAYSFGAPETVIVSSNPASRWRILQGGAVQRSADGGATWQVQNTGVTETLTAGASPSPSVCWLVGPRGIVLLSTDGRTWKRVAFPESVTLVSVSAADSETATVTTSDGRQFSTDDSGRTWTVARH